MRKLFAILGLAVAGIIALAAYPFIQVDDGRILVTDGKIQFAAAATDEPLTNGLIAYWPLDDDLLDYSANTNHGSLVGSPTQAVGKVGGAYEFSGSSQYIIVSNSASLSPVTNEISFAAWIYHKDTGNSGVFAKRLVGVAGNYWELWHNNTINTTTIGTMGIQTANSTNAVAINTWALLVTTYDGAHVRIYVNTILSDTPRVQTGNIAVTDHPVVIGMSYSTTYCYNGIIDEVAVWNRALTTNEIDRLYNSGNGRSLK